MISLCEKCRNYNWRKMQGIIDTFRDAGLERPKHIWCSHENRPEDIRWGSCDGFRPFEIPVESRKANAKPRYCNNPGKLSGHRKIGPRKASK